MSNAIYFTRLVLRGFALVTVGLALILGCTAAKAQGQQSAYFRISGPHLVQQHIYYRENPRGPACNRPVARGAPCIGVNGLIVWR